MSELHYLDETGTPKGPVSDQEIEKLAQLARQNGRPLLVAKPGDGNWLPWPGTEAAATPASAPAAPQRPAPQPATVRPAAAAQPAAAVRPQPAAQAPAPVATPVAAPAPMQMPVAMPMMSFGQPPPHSRSVPWISIVCYFFAGLFLLGFVVMLVLLIVEMTGRKDTMHVSSVFSFLLPAFSLFLPALFFAWSGQVLALLNEIAHNTSRR